jgi:N-acetylglutamate synthase-like GNAT family acetyltransferase
MLTSALRPARSADLPRVRELLESCGLPAVEAYDQFGEAYVLAEGNGDLLGVAGMEIHDDAGLLRSVAVASSVRSQGLGETLVRNRIEWANNRGVSTIYLLTTTAAEYFARRGFVIADRDSAPPAIKASREFRDVCPSSATFMKLAKGGAR